MRSTSFRTAAEELVRPAAAALRGRLHVRRRPAQGERAAAGPFSAVVSGCRP
ncbi:hypothetical protein [Streptomyces umbrinus]|uniref:hypothetical protein n=1 Tax=Streptomyces umbrinus TaxID=67370 RepID=UPI003C2EDC6A